MRTKNIEIEGKEITLFFVDYHECLKVNDNGDYEIKLPRNTSKKRYSVDIPWENIKDINEGGAIDLVINIQTKASYEEERFTIVLSYSREQDTWYSFGVWSETPKVSGWTHKTWNEFKEIYYEHRYESFQN